MTWADERLDEGLDEGLDPEGPSAEDLERFGAELNTCPDCGHEVYDQAPLCPHCGHAFEEGERSLPLWASVAGVTAIIAILLWAL